MLRIFIVEWYRKYSMMSTWICAIVAHTNIHTYTQTHGIWRYEFGWPQSVGSLKFHNLVKSGHIFHWIFMHENVFTSRHVILHHRLWWWINKNKSSNFDFKMVDGLSKQNFTSHISLDTQINYKMCLSLASFQVELYQFHLPNKDDMLKCLSLVESLK